MATLAKMVVKLVADVAGFSADMEKAQLSAVKAAEKTGKKWQEVGKGITDAGKGLTMGVTMPILAGGVAAIKYASDLEETKSKVGVVFGDMGADVLKWSQNSASAFGMSQNEALGAAGTYGNLLTSMGLGAGTAADMSKSLVGLAGDLASFNNIGTDEALEKLRAGLSGESEPLKSLGVNMNEAALKAKAMALGVWDGEGAITAGAKAQAAYAIIMDQTQKAQGDMDRTGGGLANQMKKLQSQFQDVAAQLGANLLPFVTKAVQWINNLVSQFSKFGPETQKMILIGAGIAAAIGPVLIIVGQIVSAIGAIIPVITAVAGVLTGPIALAIVAVIAVVALLAAAWANDWGGIREKTAAAWEFIKGVFDVIKVAFDFWVGQMKLIFQVFQLAWAGDWRGVGETLRKLWDNVWTILKTAAKAGFDALWGIVKDLPKMLWDLITKTNWAEVGQNILKGIADGITGAASWLYDSIKGVLDAMILIIKGFLGIASPSKVMKLTVGYQMAAGVAEGWTTGLNSLMPKTLPVMTRTAAGAGVMATRGGAGGAGGASVVINVEGGRLSDYDLARKIGDAVNLALKQTGIRR